MAAQSTSPITFLFTDIEGSTKPFQHLFRKNGRQGSHCLPERSSACRIIDSLMAKSFVEGVLGLAI